MRSKLLLRARIGSKRFVHLSRSVLSSEPHRMSRVLLLKKKILYDNTCKSSALFKYHSYVETALSGLHYLLPLATRSLTKLISIIDQEMEAIGSQKVILPTLGHLDLLKTSGKWSDHQQDIFTLQDRQGQTLFMSPTHEETLCSWLCREKLYEKQLPIFLYQVTPKFRDEARPRGGLLRGKEFIMKDLYCFDATEADAHKSYDLVCQSYQRIFDRLEVNIIKTKADTGTIGGKHSHEYHLLSDIGEDTIYLCSQCNQSFSEEYITNHGDQSKDCDNCNCDLQAKQSIEVGHAFYLATRYTKPFKCFYLTKENKYKLLEMGSYGLGVTRILASCAEVLSTSRQIKLPDEIAPYKISIIPPKGGSKEAAANQLAEDLGHHLVKYTNADVLIDDRLDLTIGHRVIDSSALGIPIVIVVGKKAIESIPIFEYINHRNANEQIIKELSFLEIMEEIKSLYPKV